MEILAQRNLKPINYRNTFMENIPSLESNAKHKIKLRNLHVKLGSGFIRLWHGINNEQINKNIQQALPVPDVCTYFVLPATFLQALHSI